MVQFIQFILFAALSLIILLHPFNRLCEFDPPPCIRQQDQTSKQKVEEGEKVKALLALMNYPCKYMQADIHTPTTQIRLC